MKFQATPNLLIRPRKTGPLKRIKPFRFDENGVYETENKYLIKVLSARFSSLEADSVAITAEISEELTDDEIRQMAKEQGIKSWHVKKINKLKEELGV
jgi:hypothetical protein